MASITAEERNWLEVPTHLVPLFELECVPDPEVRRSPRPQPRPRTEMSAASNDDASRKSPRSQARPQPSPRGSTSNGASAPPLCSLPPAKPLPTPDLLPPLKSDGWSFGNRKRPADPSVVANLITDEPDFLREALKEIEDARAEKARLAAAEKAAPPVSKKSKSAADLNPILLDLAHPLHAELQHSRRSLRGAWISMIVLMLGVIAGVAYTAVRLEKSDQHIEKLLTQLDAERAVSATYKQEVANLYRELTNVKAESTRAAARQHFATTAE